MRIADRPGAIGFRLREHAYTERQGGFFFHVLPFASCCFTSCHPALFLIVNPNCQTLFLLPELFQRHFWIADNLDLKRTESNADRVRGLPIPGANIYHHATMQP